VARSRESVGLPRAAPVRHAKIARIQEFIERD
jgi:hypothetical protein